MGVRGIGPRVEGVLIGCAIGNWGFLMSQAGWGFSLINPYGVRVKGSPLWSFRVKGCPS